MKKQRFQPTFASLTEAELEQLAEAVQRETYQAVRERICKPRSEGGLDLHFTSDSPLVRLRDKKDRLDLINARLCAECADRKKLTLAELNTFISGEHRAPEEVHHAIMSATYVLVTEQDNTPHQLLALQRLADFPARAAVRQQMSELRAAKEERAQAKDERAQAKAERDAESHAWKRELLDHKIALDLRKEAHQKEMDEQSLKLRREQFEARNASNSQRPTLNSQPNPQSDHLGPYAADLEGIRERARKHFGITPEESARRAELRRTWVDPNAHLNQHLDPNPSLPPLDESPAAESDIGNQNDLQNLGASTQK